MVKLKHKLPTFSIIDHLSLNDQTLQNLVKVTQDLETEFVSVLESNKKLCSVNHELTKSVYDNFFQISLTESEFNVDEINIDNCETGYNTFHQSGKLTGVKQKKILSETSGSFLNENEYNKMTEYFNLYNELFSGILSKFKSKPTRVRLVKLKAGTSIAPHIDYDPSYAVRIIIPIIAKPDCVNLFWVKNSVESTIFEPGKAYFLNTGYKHAVMNFSNQDRYTFMVSVNGTKDIEHLIT